MKTANIIAVLLFILLWILLVANHKDEQIHNYDDTYVKSVTIYNNSRYKEYLGPEVTREEIPEPPCTCPFTDYEIELFVIEGMREGGKLDVDAIQAIDQTIWNRVKSEDYPNTVEEVIYQENQFALHDNGEPNWKCYQAVENMLASPEAFPTDMYWFHSGHWPNYGYPYTIIDGMYFSTATDYNIMEAGE